MTLRHRARGVSPAAGCSGRRRGAVMVETVLAMPVLLAAFVLMFWVGRVMVQSQRATMLERDAAWRVTVEADAATQSHASLNDDAQWLDPRELNRLFHAGRAFDIDVEVERAPLYGAPRVWQDRARWRSLAAEQYLATLFEELPAAVQIDVRIRHGEGGAGGARRSVDRVARRLDGAWHYTQPNVDRSGTRDPRWHVEPLHVLRDRYLAGLDRELSALVLSGNPVAAALREICVAAPAYRGPDLGSVRVDSIEPH